MKRFAFGILAAAAFSGSALAADLPVKAPVAVAPVASWRGCYVGGNAGWIGADNGYALAPTGSYLPPPGGAAPPNLAGTGLFATDIVALSHAYGSHPDGGLVGAQIGCNQQNGRFVFGVEADWQWSSLRNSVDAAYPAFADTGNPAFTLPAHTEHVTSDLNWFGTFRGRAGFDFNHVFIYGTGGLAVGDIRSDSNVSFGTFPVLPVLNGAVHIGSDSSIQVGWAAGAGAEYMFAPNWSIKAEYLHLDFGTHTYRSPLVSAIAPAAVGPNYLWQTSVKNRDDIVRVGVNYRFSSGPSPSY